MLKIILWDLAHKACSTQKLDRRLSLLSNITLEALNRVKRNIRKQKTQVSKQEAQSWCLRDGTDVHKKMELSLLQWYQLYPSSLPNLEQSQSVPWGFFAPSGPDSWVIIKKDYKGIENAENRTNAYRIKTCYKNVLYNIYDSILWKEKNK